MRPFFLTFLAGVAVVAALSGFADPARTGWRRVRLPEGGIPAGEALVHVPNIDERSLKRELFEHDARRPEGEQADMIVLGSSRVMTLAQADVGPGARLLNLGTSGASVEDFLAFGQLVLERPHPAADVVMAIDPWVFNRRAGQTRWVSNLAAVMRFYDATGPDPVTMARAQWTRVSVTLSSLLGFSAARAAMQVQWGRFRGKSDPVARLVPEEALGPDDTATRADGSLRYPDSETRVLSGGEARRAAEEYVQGDPVYGLGGWEIDASVSDRLGRVIAALRARGTRVKLIALPYHPGVIALLPRRHGYEHVLDSYVNAFGSLARGAEVPACNVVDPASLGCGETEFIDGMHAQQSCVRKWAKACGLQAGDSP